MPLRKTDSIKNVKFDTYMLVMFRGNFTLIFKNDNKIPKTLIFDLSKVKPRYVAVKKKDNFFFKTDNNNFFLSIGSCAKMS